MNKIDIFLNIINTKSIDFTLKNLNFWLAAFSDYKKYNIFILNNHVNLPSYYNDNYNIINYQDCLNSNIDIKKLYLYLKESTLQNIEYLFSNILPYFLSKTEYMYNIQASNCFLLNDTDKIFSKLESLIKLKDSSCFIHAEKNQNLNFGIYNTLLFKNDIISNINKGKPLININTLMLDNMNSYPKFCTTKNFILNEVVITSVKNKILINKEQIKVDNCTIIK